MTIGQNTYINLDDARQYTLVFGLDELPAEDDDATQLLYRAAIMLDRKYGAAFIGQKSDYFQPLAWPRTYSPTLYPVELGQAQVELALMMMNGFNPMAQVEGAVTKTTDQIDVLSISREYKTGFQSDPMHAIKVILRPILNTNSSITCTRGA